MKSEDDAQGAIAPIFWNTKTHWIRTTLRDHFFRYNGENETFFEEIPIVS